MWKRCKKRRVAWTQPYDILYKISIDLHQILNNPSLDSKENIFQILKNSQKGPQIRIYLSQIGWFKYTDAISKSKPMSTVSVDQTKIFCEIPSISVNISDLYFDYKNTLINWRYKQMHEFHNTLYQVWLKKGLKDLLASKVNFMNTTVWRNKAFLGSWEKFLLGKNNATFLRT